MMFDDNPKGHRTTGVCEGFHSSAKGTPSALGFFKHSWRIDQLMYRLLESVLSTIQRKEVDRRAGKHTTLYTSFTYQLIAEVLNSILLCRHCQRG